MRAMQLLGCPGCGSFVLLGSSTLTYCYQCVLGTLGSKYQVEHTAKNTKVEAVCILVGKKGRVNLL
jgi:hypothetical protein